MAKVIPLNPGREDAAPSPDIGPPGRSTEADPLGDLLFAVARGDRQAFRRFYGLTSGRMLALARRLVGRADVAEEAVQETYVRIWRAADRFDPARGSAMAWATTILRNCAFTLRERLLRQRERCDGGALLEDVVSDEPDPLDQTLLSRDAQRVAACLQSLQPGQREAICLVYHEGLSHSELADRLAIPLGTAKSRVLRGLENLRRLFDSDAQWDLDAGLYVLGAMDADGRRIFEARRGRDAVLCLACDYWSRCLAPLAELLPSQEAPARIWDGIAGQIDGGSGEDTSTRWHRWFWPGVAGVLGALLALSLLTRLGMP